MMLGLKLWQYRLEHTGEGVPCIFDCRWSPDGFMIAAADSHGYLTLFGLGSGHIYEQVKELWLVMKE